MRSQQGVGGAVPVDSVESRSDGAPLERFVYDDAIVRAFAAATIVWGVVGMVVGLVMGLQLALPALNLGIEYTSFGRLRPVHTNTLIFAFAGNGVFTAVYYSTQRLCRTRMFSDVLSRLHFWGWQAIMAASAVTLAMGFTQGRAYAEAEWPIDIAIAVVWVGFFGVNFFGTLVRRREPRLYVSLWFFAATIVGFGAVHVLAGLAMPSGLMKSDPVQAGVRDALVRSWTVQGVMGFLLIMPFLGLMYYFVPKAAERPVYSGRLAVVQFWSLVFLLLCAGPAALHGTAAPVWVSTVGLVFAVALWMPLWGGLVNGLGILRGAGVARDPVLRFFLVGLICYGLWTLQWPMQAIGPLRGLTRYTDWGIAQTHTGTLGWNGFMIFGMLYWLLPRVFQSGLWSVRLANAHFWVGAIGLLLYVMPMYAAGVWQGLMLGAFDATGTLAYPDFVETVAKVEPLYWVRGLGGLLYLAGAVMCLLNVAMTWANRPARYEEAVQRAPALRPGAATAARSASRLHANTNVGHAVDRVLQGSWHGRLETRPVRLMVWVLVASMLGVVVQAVGVFSVGPDGGEIASVRPYTPLELVGRDIYIGEGCQSCHTQMVRPLLAETQRYGPYSRGGEFVYDHPSLWGGRRVGPDLARAGVTRPAAEWHLRHFTDPRAVSAGSIMPAFGWLLEKRIDFERIQSRVEAMAMLGVPYGDAERGGMAPELARAQARRIAREIEEASGRPAEEVWDREVVALIAYIQRLGTDLHREAAVGAGGTGDE